MFFSVRARYGRRLAGACACRAGQNALPAAIKAANAGFLLPSLGRNPF